MEEWIKGLRQFALGFSTNVFFKMLGYGIIFSLIMTLIIGDIVGVFEIKQTFPYIEVTPKTNAYWIGIVFVSFSFLFAIFGYMSDLRTKEDILSPLRKKIVGYWQVRAQTWMIEEGHIRRENNISFCTIGIEDIGRKLTMHFEVRGSDVFKDQVIDITNIALSYPGEPTRLIYFHEFDLNLKEEIGIGPDKRNSINFPFLGVLRITSRGDDISCMEGDWYDVNNSIYHLARQMPDLNGLDELTTAVENGAITFKGHLEFTRLPRPVGFSSSIR
jgi:hypothetical protein